MIKTWKKFAIATPPIILAITTIVFPVFISQTKANEDYREGLFHRMISEKKLTDAMNQQIKDTAKLKRDANDNNLTNEERKKAKQKLIKYLNRYSGLKLIPNDIGKYIRVASKEHDNLMFGRIELAFKKGTLKFEREEIKNNYNPLNDNFVLMYPLFKNEINKAIKTSRENIYKLVDYSISNLFIKSIDVKMKSFEHKVLHKSEKYTVKNYNEQNKFFKTEKEKIRKFVKSAIIKPKSSDDYKLAMIWKPIVDQDID